MIFKQRLFVRKLERAGGQLPDETNVSLDRPDQANYLPIPVRSKLSLVQTETRLLLSGQDLWFAPNWREKAIIG